MSLGPVTWLWLGGALLCVGLFGAIARRDRIAALVSVAVMAGAASMNALAISRMIPAARTTGQVLSLFTLITGSTVVAGGLAAVRRRGPRAPAHVDAERD